MIFERHTSVHRGFLGLAFDGFVDAKLEAGVLELIPSTLGLKWPALVRVNLHSLHHVRIKRVLGVDWIVFSFSGQTTEWYFASAHPSVWVTELRAAGVHIPEGGKLGVGNQFFHAFRVWFFRAWLILFVLLMIGSIWFHS